MAKKFSELTVADSSVTANSLAAITDVDDGGGVSKKITLADLVVAAGAAFLSGVAGGQTLYGGLNAGDDLTLFGSADSANPGSIILGSPLDAGGEDITNVGNMASEVQAQAGEDNATFMTPLRTKQSIDALASKACIALAYNLKANNGSASQVSVTADEVVLKNATGDVYLAASVTESAAITSSGAGGLDTGAEANSTWYYVWLIYNPTTADLAAMFSVSATAPTMPAGYTYKALVSAVYNNSIGNFADWYQRGNKITYKARQQVLSGGTATSATAVSIAINVPPIALTFLIHTRAYVATNSGGIGISQLQMQIISGTTHDLLTSYTNASTQNYAETYNELPYVANSLYYYNAISGPGVDSHSSDIFILGFTIPGGGM